MRNLLLIAAMLIGLAASAQVDDEAIYLNGGLNFSTSDVTMGLGVGDTSGLALNLSAKNTTFGINAGAGYMFTDVIGAGLSLGYAVSSTKPEIDTLGGTTSTSLFTIAPNARAYIEIDEPLYLTGIFTVAVGLGSNKTEFAGVELTNSYTTFSVLLTPGLSYFFSDNVALDVTFGQIGYVKASETIGGNVLTGNADAGGFVFGFDTSTLTFGLTVMLNN